MSLLSGNQRRSRKRAGRDGVITYRQRNWRGVYDSPDVMPDDELYLLDAFNCWFPTGVGRSGVWQRPIWSVANATKLGTSNTRLGQCIYEHVRLDGTIDRLFFAGGKIYTWDGVNTFTDITPGFTISTTARIFCCTFADKVIITDGVNQPWSYDPGPATAAVIGYDAAAGGTAWSAFGAPVVYGGKLFFILNAVGGVSQRNVIVWSEENDPSLGYGQTGGGTTYTNTWRLTQTASESLYALVATNSGLYYFRKHSIGRIAGEVNAAFQTTAQHDEVSSEQGSTTPASVILAGGNIWFLNQLGRPCRFAIGSTSIEPIWGRCDFTLSNRLFVQTVITQMARVGAATYCADMNVVIYTLVGDSGSTTSASRMLVFDADSGIYYGQWSVQSSCYSDVLGQVSDSHGFQVICSIGTNNQTVQDSTRGFVSVLQSSIYGGGLSFGDTGIRPYLTLRFVGDDPLLEKRFIRATVEAQSDRTIPAYSMNLKTGSGDTATGTAASLAAMVASDANTGYYFPVHASLGFSVVGRSLEIQIVAGTMQASSAIPHVFIAAEVEAVVLSRNVAGR